MSALLVVPLVGPLLAAGALLALPGRPVLRRAVALVATAAVLAVGGALLAAGRGGEVPVVRVGDWPAVVAITLAADPLSALLVTVTATVVLACLVAAAATGEDRRRAFLPLALVLSAGAYGALLTTDLFNLFVLVEVMLVPSYVLLALSGGPGRAGAGRVYVATNLLGSTLLLTGVGLIYGITGTVGLADLAGAARDVPAVAVAGGLVLLAFALKSALVPLHDWLPRAYPVASPVVVALFSGLLTKVGLYAVIRVYAVLYGGDPAYHPLLVAVALASMVVGVLGAVGAGSMRRVLSFHMVSQVGYVLLGLALFTAASLAAAVFYLAQYVLVKAALFLCAAAVRTVRGTDRLSQLGGLARARPVLALAFGAAALSLAGLPPFGGFLAKFLVLRAAGDVGDWLSMTVAVLVSLVTLLSMLKIWGAVFWGEAPARAAPQRPTRAGPALVGPPLALGACALLLGPLGGPLLQVADAAAAGLLEPAGYVRAVSGR
ncbi:monovalent cation/H+ antiporter subunit D family protein [Micromonospora sp. WMMC415]|uniref:proton-conducting transporter transmembrane domain-containing protein n=1 Tax=Micromonospora sp. WMMC415 TaxID=2675222 RepID=UPI0012B4D88A|nr:proton-conducting transporter membrane subunit [Micromonospora sp. WMMC415]QGN47690.1 monovalent cation/H+ antiporter subunit D family protein [Micromonospora sp. WMMC415]